MKGNHRRAFDFWSVPPKSGERFRPASLDGHVFFSATVLFEQNSGDATYHLEALTRLVFVKRVFTHLVKNDLVRFSVGMVF